MTDLFHSIFLAELLCSQVSFCSEVARASSGRRSPNTLVSAHVVETVNTAAITQQVVDVMTTSIIQVTRMSQCWMSMLEGGSSQGADKATLRVAQSLTHT